MPIAGLSPKETVHQELHKFKHHALHSGSEHGPLVKSRPQAIAIALSEARRAKGRAMGGPLPMPMQRPMAGFGQAAPQQMPSMGGGYSPMMSPAAPIPNAGYRPMGRQFGGLTRPPAASWTVRNEARNMLHSGPISSVVPGRTDRHNVNVGSGAYVLPADHVSSLGQGNTKAGHAILNHMFGSGGPYGVGNAMPIRHGAGAPKAPGLSKTPALKLPGLQSAGGGKGDETGHPVPIVVAGGEYTIPPHVVEAIGGGDIKRGHRILDAWVLSNRKKHIKTLQKLPGPAKA